MELKKKDWLALVKAGRAAGTNHLVVCRTGVSLLGPSGRAFRGQVWSPVSPVAVMLDDLATALKPAPKDGGVTPTHRLDLRNLPVDLLPWEDSAPALDLGQALGPSPLGLTEALKLGDLRIDQHGPWVATNRILWWSGDAKEARREIVRVPSGLAELAGGQAVVHQTGLFGASAVVGRRGSGQRCPGLTRMLGPGSHRDVLFSDVYGIVKEADVPTTMAALKKNPRADAVTIEGYQFGARDLKQFLTLAGKAGAVALHQNRGFAFLVTQQGTQALVMSYGESRRPRQEPQPALPPAFLDEHKVRPFSLLPDGHVNRYSPGAGIVPPLEELS